MFPVLLVQALSWLVVLADPEVTPQDGAATGVKEPAEAAAPKFASAEALLEALERAAEPMQTLTARIQYTNEDPLLGDRTVRTGMLYFRKEPTTGARQFAVKFETLQSGDTKEQVSKDYIFDGIWLVERLPKEKQFFKRQTVKTGEQIDPLSIDGPFPLPIGQKKADILRRFEATLGEPESSGIRKGFIHLHLKARDQTERESIEEVDLWYDPVSLLPGKVIVRERSGDVNVAELVQAIANGSVIDEATFDTTTPSRDEGWYVEVAPLKE